MTETHEIIVTEGQDFGGEIKEMEFTLSDNLGHLLAVHSSGIFGIAMIEVELPRIGLGKALLRRAEVEAKALGMRRMTATIISRECLSSMIEVFGEESVAVEIQSPFNEPRDMTRAMLDHKIEPIDILKIQ